MADEQQAEIPTPAPSRGSKLTVILLGVNLLATGGVGALVFLSGGSGVVLDAKAEEEEPERVVTTLDPFVVNLHEEGSSRYLKTTLEFELTSQEAADHFQVRLREVRDDILGYLSSLSVDDTLGEVNKDKIRTEMVRRASAHLKAGALKQIYFTEFVVQ